MILLIAENNAKTSSICYQKSLDKIWNFKMSSQDQKEYNMKNFSKHENSETKAMLEEIKLLI
jgi:hypothetical protein